MGGSTGLRVTPVLEVSVETPLGNSQAGNIETLTGVAELFIAK